MYHCFYLYFYWPPLKIHQTIIPNPNLRISVATSCSLFIERKFSSSKPFSLSSFEAKVSDSFFISIGDWIAPWSVALIEGKISCSISYEQINATEPKKSIERYLPPICEPKKNLKVSRICRHKAFLQVQISVIISIIFSLIKDKVTNGAWTRNLQSHNLILYQLSYNYRIN